jgi:23S rRNA (adenine1618-N6)-methyltransferase
MYVIIVFGLLSSSDNNPYEMMMKFPTCINSCAILLVSTRSVRSFTTAKEGFHVRNKHRFGYDLDKCIASIPDLKQYVRQNKFGQPSVDFSNPSAVKAVNHAMLKSCYGVDQWSIPDNYLCPSIPSRADYIHRISDLVAQSAHLRDPAASVVGLDIGVGASCIYPIVGVTDYNWKFVGTDVDDAALASAQFIVSNNPHLQDSVKLRKQKSHSSIFRGVVKKGDKFDFCLSNPPFHSSIEAAHRGSERKWRNLNIKNTARKGGKAGRSAPVLSFGGLNNELVCEGGEVGFVARMIKESSDPFIRSRVKIFSSLVSSQDNLNVMYRLLDKTVGIAQVYTVEMQHGQKKSRILAWTYTEGPAVGEEDGVVDQASDADFYDSDDYDDEDGEGEEGDFDHDEFDDSEDEEK